MKNHTTLALRFAYSLSLLVSGVLFYIGVLDFTEVKAAADDVVATALTVTQVGFALAALAFAVTNCHHQQFRLCEIEELSDRNWTNGVRIAFQREVESVTIWTQLTLQAVLLACRYLTDVTSFTASASLAVSSLVVSALTGFTVFAVMSAQKLMTAEAAFWTGAR